MGLKGVSMQRDGSKISCIRFSNIYLGEIRKLMSAGASLSQVAKICELELSKSIFPFARFTSEDFLFEKEVILFTKAADYFSNTL